MNSDTDNSGNHEMQKSYDDYSAQLSGEDSSEEGGHQRGFSPSRGLPNTSPQQPSNVGFTDGQCNPQFRSRDCTNESIGMNKSPRKLKRDPIHNDQDNQSKMTAKSGANIKSESIARSPVQPGDHHHGSQRRSPPPAGISTSSVQNLPFEKLLPEKLGLVLISGLIILVVAIVLYWARPGDDLNNFDPLKTDQDHILSDFLKAFDKLKNSFPSQTSLFWTVLRAGTRSIMCQKPPDQPAVFIIAVPQGADQTALCIVRKYANIVTESFKAHDAVEFSRHLRGADTPDHMKEVIDDILKVGFSQGSRVAIIHDLDRLHGESAMMFHGYCDNENAPFTRVAFVLMLRMGAVDGDTDDLVEKRLSDVWSNHLNRDTLLPLLSRIGNRNAFVSRESDEVLQTNDCSNAEHFTAGQL